MTKVLAFVVRVVWTNCGECSCPECKHITAVKLYCAKVQAARPVRRSHPLAEAEPLPCTGCHFYHLTEADRLKAHPDARRDLAPGGAAWLAVQKAVGGWP